MDVLFILGAFQSFFLAFLIFRKKNKITGDHILGIWLTILGLHLTYYYFFTTDVLFNYPHLLGIHAGFYVIDGPLAYVYVLVMINKDGRFHLKYLLHGLWCVGIYGFFLFDFFLLSAAEKLNYFEILYNDPPKYFLYGTLPTVLITPAYFVIALVKLQRHRINISDSFSYTEEIDLKWLSIILLCLGIVSVSGVVANILVQFRIFSVEGHEDLEFYTYFVAVFFIGYYGIKQKNIYSDDPIMQKPLTTKPVKTKPKDENRYRHSGLKLNEAEAYMKSLLEYFEKDKPYLNGKLSLKEVADQLEISVNHLSQVINEQLGKNFFDFVNAYRVEEVRQRLSDKRNQDLTLLGIAYDSGFNSKSSFNSIFKKLTGITPSQYVKEIQR